MENFDANRFIDLSHTIATGLPVYPGDPDVTVESAATIDADGFAVTSLRLGSHSGTHVDAPSHTIPGGRTIDQVRLNELCGAAVVLQLPGLEPLAPITTERLKPLLDTGLGGARIVLLATGWDQHWGSDTYFEHPVITPETALALVDLGMHVLGTDTLNPDPTGGDTLPVHSVVLGGDHLIIENLCGLSALPQRIHFTAQPLRLGGVDGSPVRAFAVV